MIRVVKEMLVEAINQADRTEVNSGYRTRFIAERRNIIDTLKEGATRVWIDAFGNTSNLNMRNLELLCADAWNTFMTAASYRSQYSTSSRSGGTTGIASINGGGRRDLEIRYVVGGYGEGTTNPNSQFTAHQATIAALQTQMYKHIQDGLTGLPQNFKRPGQGGGGRGNQMGAGKFKQTATKSRVSQGGGQNIGFGSLHQGNLQGEQTTIAAVGGLEKMKEGTADMQEKMFQKLEDTFAADMERIGNVDINAAYTRIHEEMTQAFAVRVGLERTALMSVAEMRNQIEIQTELDPMHRNPEMADYDTRELKRFINGYDMALLRAVQGDLTDEDFESSRSPMKHLTAAVPALMIMKMFKHKSRPDMRLKVNKRLVKEFKKKHKFNDRGKVSGKKKGKGKVTITTGKRAKAVAGRGKKGKSVERAATTQSPIALRNLLNEMLPQVVASKMNEPALRFRTGRFANSAEVKAVSRGPRGGTYIDYTYMKFPYQTFEPGFKQGSTHRDPRKIIGESIREIAMGLIGRQPTAIRRM